MRRKSKSFLTEYECDVMSTFPNLSATSKSRVVRLVARPVRRKWRMASRSQAPIVIGADLDNTDCQRK